MSPQLYAHPTTTTSPDAIQALQDRLGLRAVIEGHRVRLVGEPRPAPRAIERRAGRLFLVGAPQ